MFRMNLTYLTEKLWNVNVKVPYCGCFADLKCQLWRTILKSSGSRVLDNDLIEIFVHLRISCMIGKSIYLEMIKDFIYRCKPSDMPLPEVLEWKHARDGILWKNTWFSHATSWHWQILNVFLTFSKYYVYGLLIHLGNVLQGVEALLRGPTETWKSQRHLRRNAVTFSKKRLTRSSACS